MILKRGYGPLRKNQSRAIAVALEIVSKRRDHKVVVAGVTPGGGKTLMASLFANTLADHGIIQRVIVVVPNDALRQQMVDGFHDRSRGLDRFLRAPSGQTTLAGTGIPFGQVVTYQLLMNPKEAKRLARWCAEVPTLVIFDECHHLCSEKAWEVGARALVESCPRVLCMSGTLWRWDEGQIPFLHYDDNGRAAVDIRYSRNEALVEQAVLPVEFAFVDGNVLYDNKSVPHDTRLTSATMKEQPRALKTALSDEKYASEFIATALQDWERYRERYYRSSAIVVCHSKRSAQRAYRLVRKDFPKHSSALSLDGEPNSDRAIKKFRSGDHAILVTVRKAYEGLDVPCASHLVYLGDSRSTPFLDQVIARVTRFNDKADLPWADQRGHVYVPDDKRMREYVDNMLNEQAEYFREKQRGSGVGVERPRSTFRPRDASVTSVGFGYDGHCLTTEENIGVRELEKLYPHMRAPMVDKLDMATKMGLVPLAPGATDAAAE